MSILLISFPGCGGYIDDDFRILMFHILIISHKDFLSVPLLVSTNSFFQNMANLRTGKDCLTTGDLKQVPSSDTENY